MKSNSSADILIRNVSILPGSDPKDFIQKGWLSIKNGLIEKMGAGDSPDISTPETIRGDGCLAMPGLINAHTHAAMVLFRGLADDLPLKAWLEEHIYPAEAKWVNAEFVYWGTLLACAEMIRSGTTTFADGYFFGEQAARAVNQAGLRVLFGQGISDFPTPDSPTPAEALKNAETFIQTCASSALIRPALFPHSTYTCSPELLRRCRDLANRSGASLMIHLAETRDEIKEVYKKYGKTPIEHLETLGLLSSTLIACHCVWPTEKEMNLLAKRNVKVVHNPESNMKLASGAAPIPELQALGITVGLGTDGCASNNNLDLFLEMDSAAKLHKAYRLDPTVMPPNVVLEMATLGGAKVLGLEQEIGSLEVGKKADIILLHLHRAHLHPVYNMISHLVYSANGSDVRDVIINGKVIMRDRRLLTLDEEEILRMTHEWGNRIRNKRDS